jgi:hypothetical protein
VARGVGRELDADRPGTLQEGAGAEVAVERGPVVGGEDLDAAREVADAVGQVAVIDGHAAHHHEAAEVDVEGEAGRLRRSARPPARQEAVDRVARGVHRVLGRGERPPGLRIARADGGARRDLGVVGRAVGHRGVGVAGVDVAGRRIAGVDVAADGGRVDVRLA